MPARLTIDDLGENFRQQLEAQGLLTGMESLPIALDFDKMLLLYQGSQKWDYYLDFKSKLVYCRAKEGTDVEDACFGTLTSFNHTRERYVL